MARQRYPFLEFHFSRVYALGLVLPGAAFDDRYLLYLRPCRDQSRPVRSPGGRIRTRRRLPHRVQWFSLGCFLPRRIWQYDHRIGNCHVTLPGWMVRSWRRVFDRFKHGFWLAITRQPSGHSLLRYQGLPALLCLHLGTQHPAAPACRPAHAVCLVEAYTHHLGEYPVYSPGLPRTERHWAL